MAKREAEEKKISGQGMHSTDDIFRHFSSELLMVMVSFDSS